MPERLSKKARLTICVKELRQVPAKFEKIVTMIEESRETEISSWKVKQNIWQISLVPYSTCWNRTDISAYRECDQSALSILMVDFSCALKLAMPISVLVGDS